MRGEDFFLGGALCVDEASLFVQSFVLENVYKHQTTEIKTHLNDSVTIKYMYMYVNIFFQLYIPVIFYHTNKYQILFKINTCVTINNFSNK